MINIPINNRSSLCQIFTSIGVLTPVKIYGPKMGYKMGPFFMSECRDMWTYQEIPKLTGKGKTSIGSIKLDPLNSSKWPYQLERLKVGKDLLNLTWIAFWAQFWDINVSGIFRNGIFSLCSTLDTFVSQFGTKIQLCS